MKPTSSRWRDLLHGKEEHVWADSGYRGAQMRVAREDLQWHIAARPSDIAKLPEGRAQGGSSRSASTARPACGRRSSIPFRVIKRQFGLMKVRFRGLAKNTAHVVTLFALSNLWMARRAVDGDGGVVRPKAHEARRTRRKPLRSTSSELTRRARLLDESNGLAFSRCSDLP